MPTGGRAMPTLTRTKSLPRCWMIERKPLCPPAPPPTFTRTSPAGRSRSSCTTTSCSTLNPARATPELFIYVVGLRSVTSFKPRPTWAASAFFFARQEPPWRFASSSETRNPMLWRGGAEEGGGCPMPTTTGDFPPSPSGSSPAGSSLVRASPAAWWALKRRESLRLKILSGGACLPLLNRNLFGPLFTLDLLGLFVGRLLDDAGGLYLLVRDLRRRRDGCGDLLGVGDQLYTLGELHVGQGEVVADLETRDVEREPLGYVARQGLDLDVIGDLIQYAPLANTRRVLYPGHRKRHRYHDPLAHVHRREVHMHQPARDRVTLHIHDANRGVVLTAEFQVVERVVADVLEGVVHHLRRDREHGASDSATVAVEDSRHHTLRPQAPGIVLATALALSRL